MRRILPLLFLTIIILLFFWQFLFKGLLPIPSDTIVGLYHPFRDLYSKEYPNGIPFKNFLITDPVRQQYPWRELSINTLKRFELPLWNPYSFSGTPLLANLQSASLYPLNIIFFIFPINFAWSFLILLTPILASLFTYFYLNNLKLNKWASFLGAFVFSFSGFSIAWLEWGTLMHVGLWLPLILLSIDKIFYYSLNKKFSIFNFQFSIFLWGLIFIFSITSSFLAGHLQPFFYVFIFSLIYFFVRWFQLGKKINILFLFIILNSLFVIFTYIQWMPTLQLISESGRDIDLNWQKEGWFIPFNHLIQFIFPDFFGNPTTLNYWGAWNYGELVGYVGIFPLILAFFNLFFRHDKKTLFFGSIFFLSLIFSTPSLFAKIPYLLNIPFLSTSQPTRLLFMTDFSLAVLAALGFDYFLKRKKGIIYPLTFVALIILAFWILIFGKGLGMLSVTNLAVAKNNLIFPTLVFLITVTFFFALIFLSKNKRVALVIYVIIVTITIFDLLRFSLKFTPFTKKEYLFPDTKTVSFLKNQPGIFRIMTIDDRILPPNFSVIYRLQSVNGYDPLYLRRYGELIAASERGKPDISTPFGFNRIINPHEYNSKIMNMLGVKYVLSLSSLPEDNLKKVFQEGKTIAYENKNYLPRTFFVKQVKSVKDKKEAIKKIFSKDFNPKEEALIENETLTLDWSIGKAEIISYTENKVIIKTENSGEGFLVFTDVFYPTWHAKVDNIETKIYLTDYAFRGVIVPKGKHTVEFYISLI